MKAATVFALRVLALTLVLIIVFMIAINVAGMAQAPLPFTSGGVHSGGSGATGRFVAQTTETLPVVFRAPDLPN